VTIDTTKNHFPERMLVVQMNYVIMTSLMLYIDHALAVAVLAIKLQQGCNNRPQEVLHYHGPTHTMRIVERVG
jgi:hypothetical protein